MLCPQNMGVGCLGFGFVLFLKNNSLPTFASRQDLSQMQDQFQTPTMSQWAAGLACLFVF